MDNGVRSSMVRTSPKTVGAIADKRGVPTKKPYPVATAIWFLVAALVPLDRFLVQDASLSTLIWRVVLAILVLSFIARRFSAPSFPAAWLSALVLLPAAGFISGHSSSVQQSLTVAVQLALLCALAPFVLKFYCDNARDFLPWVIGGFLISQTVSAVAGLAQLSGAEVLGAGSIFGRSTGLAGHPNVLGIMSVLAIFASVAAWGHRGRKLRVLSVVVLAVNAGALVATGSISSMIALVVGLVVFFGVKRQLTRVIVVGVVGTAAVWAIATAIGLGPATLLDPVSNRLEVVLGTSTTEGGAASLGTRILTYQWALRYIGIDPIVGVGMDPTNAGTYNGYTPVHNFILHAWYQGGFLFFAWMVTMAVVVIVLVGRAIVRRTSPLPAALVAVVMAFAATSAFFDEQQYWLPLLLGVALLGGRKVVVKGANRGALNRRVVYGRTT